MSDSRTNLSKPSFGSIPNIKIGHQFKNRAELAKAGVHRNYQTGIVGAAKIGAESIVISGGYSTDIDNGDTIIYTGYDDKKDKIPIRTEDQKLHKWNLALVTSKNLGLPIRVVRGSDHRSIYSPESGYRYDGLYQVVDYWRDRDENGFHFFRYKLVALSGESNLFLGHNYQENKKGTQRRDTFISRIVRDRKLAEKVKKIYNYRCQICNILLEGNAGPYAIAAHIKPIGEPHNGPDELENILCLCPNHHVMFDIGSFTINDDFSLVNMKGKLFVTDTHRIERKWGKNAY